MGAPKVSWCTNGGNRRLVPTGLLLCVVVSFLGGGCGASPQAASDGGGIARLTVVAKQYAGYLNTHQNHPPANEAEFKKLLTDAGSAILKKAGANTVDELLVSPRDGQPFVIEYGAAAGRLIDHGIIAYERTGKDGTHLIGYRLGYVEAADADKFRTAIPKP